MQTQIKRWGNSAAIRLSSRLLAKAGLQVSSDVDIEVKGGRIIIEPVKQGEKGLNLPYTEADLLEDLTPGTAHADEVAAPLNSEIID